MKMFWGAISALCLMSSHLVAGTTYTHVPMASVSSEAFPTNNDQARAAARESCEQQLQATQRLLQRKGVDIILEVRPCSEEAVPSLPEFPNARYSGEVYFMN